MRPRRMDDAGVAAVIGAIVVLAVLGIGIVYVNAYHVPKQGEGLEVAAAASAEASLIDLSSALSERPTPLAHDVPLRAGRSSPPLMAGVVLSPARTDGRLALETDASSNLTVSVLLPAPAGGVPANDPTRVEEDGKMRVYLLGSSTKGQPMGALRATTGGAHLAAASSLLEGGAVVADTEAGSALAAPPALAVTSADGRTSLSWRVPLLAGAPAEVTGAPTAQVGLVPGPEAHLGGGSRVDEVRIRVETPRVAAWQAALASLVGARGTVTTSGVADDAGFVDVVVKDAKLDLYLVRYDVSLAERSG